MIVFNRWSLGGAIPKEYKYERFQIGAHIFQLIAILYSPVIKVEIFLTTLEAASLFVSNISIMPAVRYYSINRRFQNNSLKSCLIPC